MTKERGVQRQELLRAQSTGHRRVPYRAWLVVIFAVALAATGVSPHDRSDWFIEHLPTMAALGFFIWYERRHGGSPLSNTTYTLLLLFTLLHVIGAYYLYSRVPYAEWYRTLFDTTWPGDVTRNHYDRFVHLCFGLLVLPTFAEMVQRHVTRSRGWILVIAIAFVGVLSKLYELAEWGIAVALSPETAEAYNGQQGDVFDAHKDMALAFAGSLISSMLVASRIRRRIPPISSAPTPTNPRQRTGG